MANGPFSNPQPGRGAWFFEDPSTYDPVEEGLQQARANAIHQASRAVQQGDTQFARDILMPFGITSELDRGRAAPRAATPRAATPRVIGSADRGYSAYNPDTGQVDEILPGRQGVLSDIDKARVRMASDERSQIIRSLNELPATHASRPALEAKLAEVESRLNQIFGGQQAPQPEPQKAPQAAQQQTPRPAPRNQIFIGGQTALEPEEVARLEAAERGYFGSGMSKGMGSALPPVDSGVPPPDQPAGPFDAFNANFRENFGLPIAQEPGSQSTINAPAAQFQPPAPPVSRNFPTNQQGLRQFGTEAEAINAGVKPGEVFEVFDRATQRFRPARLRN